MICTNTQIFKKFTSIFTKTLKSLPKLKSNKIIASLLVVSTILTIGGIFLFQKLNQGGVSAQALSLPSPEIWKADFNSQTWNVATNSSSNVTWNKESEGYYFGNKNTKTFENGKNQVSGFIESQPIIIPTDSSYYLNLSHRFGVEQSISYDKMLVQVTSNNSITKTFDLRNDSLVPLKDYTIATDYQTSNLDISEFAGSEIRVRFVLT